MREKLITLPLTQLRELAKSQGIKGASSLRKAELVDLLCEAAEKKMCIRDSRMAEALPSGI